MSKVQVDTIDTRSGTSTMQIGSTNTSTINIGVSGDTVNIPSGVTIANAGTATGFGGDNTPFFRAYLSSDQSIGDSVRTTIIFNAESFDASSAYDTSNGRFTPQTAGYYYISAQLKSDTATNFEGLKVYLRKNGTELLEGNSFNDAYNSVFGSTIIQLNGSSDYVDVAGNQNSGGSINLDGDSDGKKNFFQAFRLIS